MRGVEPLRPSRRTFLQPPRRPAGLREQVCEKPEAPAGAADAELAFFRSGWSKDLLRKLRRGHWRIEDELDLHGMNRREASVMVAEFLRSCHQRSVRCVRIVHGKGLGSRNRVPVLKEMLAASLAARKDVLAFCQAPAAQGGGGAVLVLLTGRERR